MQELDWDAVTNEVEAQVRQALAAREEKLLGKDGQITRDLELALERVSEPDDQGASTSFDAKTHRQVRQVFTRLHYGYLVGEILRNSDSETLEDEVLEHLQNAQAAQRRAWGESERVRLGLPSVSPAPASKTEDGEEDEVEKLGHGIQTQIYRQVLLGAITELWVDYLTRVEALRISVGLEAYAQSDPLVKYKSQASEMFQDLLADIRSAVIGRIFLYQPRPAAAQAETGASSRSRPEQVEVSASAETPAPLQSADKKKKRHRH